MSAPQPGWYPDAIDPARERWWDGSGWSAVTRPVSRTGVDAPREGVRRHPEPGPSSEPQPGPSSEPQPTQGERSPWAPPPPGLPDNTSGRGAFPGAGAGVAPVRPGPTTPDGQPLAAPGRRLLARIIDSLVTSGLAALVGLHWLLQIVSALRPSFEAAVAGQDGENPFAVLTEPGMASVVERYAFVGLLVGMVYSVTLTHLFGGTLGKLAVGVRVRSWDEQGRPSWGQALARWLTREPVPSIPVIGPTFGTIYWMIDSVWLLRDPRRQCLHDKLPGTAVVRVR